MACGCAGGKKSTQDDPITLGDPVGDARQVKATVNVLGMKANETGWVRGSHVDAMIAQGWLQAV